jgi:hypothetical protein
MKQNPFTFLFNANNESYGFNYGYFCNQLFFSSLLKSEYVNSVNSRILLGDILLKHVCQRITNVSIDSKDRRVSGFFKTDSKLFASVVWDLAESICSQWNTIEESDFPLTLASSDSK